MTNYLYDPPQRPAIYRPPVRSRSPYRIPRGRNAALIAGAFLMAGIVMVVVLAARSGTELSSRDKHYLAVIHDPCAHSEVLDTARCRRWGQQHWKWPDDQTLVKDARDVCVVERDARIDVKIRTGGEVIAARHPNYFDLQVGVAEVAARNIYCPNVIHNITVLDGPGG
jgi:hypothetical protein